MATTVSTNDESPYRDLLLARANYWCGQRGKEDPPQPSYRMVDGESKLGRYIDVYGCQVNMLGAQLGWQKKYIPILLGAGAGLLFAEVSWLFLLFFLPIFGLYYLLRRSKYRRQYVLYFEELDHLQQTGQMHDWMPYDSVRLRAMKEHPEAMWP